MCQECIVIKPLVASESECTATLFLNYQSTISIRTKEKELGHPQPATPMRVDNTRTYDCVHYSLQQKKSKEFDMQLHFPQDIINNEQFETHWVERE